MALDDLIARLEQDADAQVASLARSAADEIAAIVAATDQTLAARTRETLAAARRGRQLDYARASTDHRRRLRARGLTAAHAVLDRVFARARERLPAAAQRDDWKGLWTPLALEALSYAGGAACRLRSTPDIIGVLRSAACLGTATVLVEDNHLGPGLIVEALDGSVRVDARVDTLLAQRRDALAMGLLAAEVLDAT